MHLMNIIFLEPLDLIYILENLPETEPLLLFFVWIADRWHQKLTIRCFLMDGFNYLRHLDFWWYKRLGTFLTCTSIPCQCKHILVLQNLIAFHSFENHARILQGILKLIWEPSRHHLSLLMFVVRSLDLNYLGFLVWKALFLVRVYEVDFAFLDP